jgi:hypothetical protein
VTALRILLWKTIGSFAGNRGIEKLLMDHKITACSWLDLHANIFTGKVVKEEVCALSSPYRENAVKMHRIWRRGGYVR